MENVVKRSALKAPQAKSFIRSSLMAEELALSKELPVIIYDCNLLSYLYYVLYFNYASNARLHWIVTVF